MHWSTVKMLLVLGKMFTCGPYICSRIHFVLVDISTKILVIVFVFYYCFFHVNPRGQEYRIDRFDNKHLYNSIWSWT